MIEIQVFETKAQWAKRTAAFTKRIEIIDAVSFDSQAVLKAMRLLYGRDAIIVIIYF